MRSEQEMLDLILGVAQADERIRAVIMNGSRTDPHAPRDIFQDYDVVYVVTDVAAFINAPAWIDCFGERMIMQLPDTMGDAPPADGSFAYLMQFVDGNRIDLTLFPLAALDRMARDSLSVLLLDKDGGIAPFGLPHDGGYLPSPPPAKEFADCCNEFWWVATYVAKGLWRNEITYAKFMQDQVMRDQLMKMLVWFIGVKTDFTRAPGKYGKYLRRYLEPELWAMLEQSYADASSDRTWDSLFVMAALFRRAAQTVATHFGYAYPQGDDEGVSAHLAHVRRLPKDAQGIYPRV
jgi:aminoglycoside 6-adenylyltransferase